MKTGVFTVGPNVTSFRDHDYFDAAVFYYRVKAFNEEVTSTYSNVSSTLLVTGTDLSTTFQINLNSTTHRIDLLWIDDYVGDVGLKLFNALGKCVYQASEVKRSSEFRTSSAVDLHRGMYFFYMSTAHTVYSRKIWVK